MTGVQRSCSSASPGPGLINKPAHNPLVSAQVHRIGQSQPVEAIRLVAADTVDETIVELQAIRRGNHKKGASGTGDLRVAELVKLFNVEQDDA